MWSNKGLGPVLGAMPKSAVGFLPHREEPQLAKLWSEMIKCEQGCHNAVTGARHYSDKAVAVQQQEEKLFTRLQEVSSHQTSPDLHNALQAMENLLPQVRDCTPEACGRLDDEVCSAVREYQALYTSVDALRTKRDLLVAELNRIQDRIEKLRLKGKRSTDVIVEKERTLKQLQEVQALLLKEVAAFHNLRDAYLLHTLHCYTDIQFLQYGGQAQHYKNHVVGSPAHQPNLSRLNDTAAHHLAKLRALNITDSKQS